MTRTNTIIASLQILLLVSACRHGQAADGQTGSKSEKEAETTATREVPSRNAEEDFTISGGLGTLTEEQIEQPIRARFAEVKRCYDTGKEKFWYLGGRVEIKVRVAQTGMPKVAYLSSSNLGNYDVEKCILAVVRSIHFASPVGGKEAEFVYPIDFQAKASVWPWDPGRLQPLLRSARFQRDVQECAARGKHADGSLVLTLYVAPGGKVPSAGISAETPVEEPIVQCLLGKARTWRLDDPLGRIAKAQVEVAR